MEIVLVILALVAGFLVGVLVNLLADYLPENYYRGLQRYLEAQVAEGKSQEPVPQFFPEGYSPMLRPHYKDGTLRPQLAWSGLGAFFAGKRTSPSGAKLSLRYPLVEVALMGLYGFVVAVYPDYARLGIWLIYIPILVLITVIDLEHFLILRYHSVIPAAILAAIFAVVFPEPHLETVDYFIGGAVGYGIFWIFYALGNVYSHSVKTEEVAFGFGDVTLAALSGLMIGWQGFVFAALIAVFAGGAISILVVIVSRVLYGKSAMLLALPYGPNIVIGTLLMMIGREEIATLLGGG